MKITYQSKKKNNDRMASSKNMQLQVIQEGTSVAEQDGSITTLDMTKTNSYIENKDIFAAEEIDSVDGKGSQKITE